MLRPRLAFLLVPVALTAVTFGGSVGAQQIPGLSAFFDGPNPNPVQAGSTAALTAQFSVPNDVGPVTVSIELQGAGALGSLSLDAGVTSSELLNCTPDPGAVIACDWDGEVADGPQILAVIVSVDATTPPNTSWNLAAIGDSATTEPETLATAQVFTSPPSGSITLSGTVQTLDEVPVVGACIFILASPSAVFQAISDDDGNWSLGALPDGYQFAIATVAPFEGEFGPCTNDGPPPVPGPDDLQPVFFDDVWFDLGDPELVGGQSDPYVYAIEHGATPVTGTTSGLDACLTTAPADAIPRPSCAIVVATTTTTSTTTTTTEPASTTTVGPTTTADPGTTTTTAVGGITSVPRPPTTVLLPVTGTSTDGVGVIAALILGIGVAALVATRRPRRAGRP